MKNLSFFCILLIIFLCGCLSKSLAPAIVEGGIRFSINAPNARRVNIVGSFNRWDVDKNALSDSDHDGIWNVILPLKEGRYEYLFLIDKEKWLLDPSVPSIDDGLGGRNSVIYINR